jgi:hydrogenase maturation protein HypF
MKGALIRVSGIVQGVGFRPFVFRVAKERDLCGYVKNLGDAGVEIRADGAEKDILALADAIKNNPPENARIDDMTVEWSPSQKVFSDFSIIESGGAGIGGMIPPDWCVCEECLQELSSAKDRRHNYPLITCVSCGPRFTTLKHVPVDRSNTSFGAFPPCKECEEEYDDPENRRFFAQTVACPKCGPKYVLLDKKKKQVKDPIKSAVKLLSDGKILAIKGVGGFHLACLTSDDAVVAELRKRRRRPQQPFAVMATLPMIKKFAEVSEDEEKLLVSKERPIVVVRKSESYGLSEFVAPALHNVGVMLPYSGLHHLLFEKIKEPLVMTSANVHGEPMIISDDDIFKDDVADYFLLHDLEIINRCDDSVTKIVNKKPAFIRRSRGFVPLHLSVKENRKNILALGAELNNTFCLVRGSDAYLSQHIGNTERVSTLHFMESTIERFLEMIPVKVDTLACDLHPSFNTTKLGEDMAKRLDVPLVRVQHHIAHIASLMAEHGLEEIVGICCDGVGFGSDNKPWGGEVFSAEGAAFRRVGHLSEQRMPGGDAATRYPAKMVAGMLYGKVEDDELLKILSSLEFKHGKQEASVVLQQLEKNINVQLTTSTGRVLDAVSALLGVCQHRSYDGEPAIKLESAGVGGRWVNLPIEVKDGVLDTSAILLRVFELRGKESVRDLSYSVQRALAEGLAGIAVEAAKKDGISTVGISGGVAYNDLFVRTVAGAVEEAGLSFVQNVRVPAGDGGVSFGQAAYAALITRP